MIRGGLVTLVYDATLKLHSSKATDAAAVTHMSTDIDQITQGMTNFDVLWAAPIEVGLAIYILWREIGLACLAPVGIAVGCTLAAFLLGKLSRKAQRVWVDAVQLRTTATVSMLNNIKGIRMSGLSSRFSTNIQDLRVKELAASKSYRHLTVLKNTIGTLPQVMGPITAFVIYVLVRQNQPVSKCLRLLARISSKMSTHEISEHRDIEPCHLDAPPRMPLLSDNPAFKTRQKDRLFNLTGLKGTFRHISGHLDFSPIFTPPDSSQITPPKVSIKDPALKT
ncbi:multidrug resistance-associated protein, putative [Talaromyces stipitatus ATCC 10500]|uniref:Multidrug resistance-associated protein, putative n=1 Tax=Talaromyces stipitatus (strain ATCC 10500 / CBS 375.48 / QM 6759 / NRRL 1006) TaxID=441959 RepID=B8MI63_TALSN|nr:multidrug resistance-associated protein, putative [Talaromyces stipitatus ATCC 10500]EED17225.1 multidrug resistance-associated protein, putative [Talaromyces stipitatus ATCC 10500]